MALTDSGNPAGPFRAEPEQANLLPAAAPNAYSPLIPRSPTYATNTWTSPNPYYGAQSPAQPQFRPSQAPSQTQPVLLNL